MEKGYYTTQTGKLEKTLLGYLKQMKTPLTDQYGVKKTHTILERSRSHYTKIIPHIPYFHTPMYDSLILLCSRMLALKKGLKDDGVSVEDFVLLTVESTRRRMQQMPTFLRKIGGRIYLSKLVRPYLKRVGRSATAHGWPTEVIDGQAGDDYAMKVCTHDCQMVNFITAVGEEDLNPYCSVFDFTMAESLGMGLRQISTIDSGKCVYCFSQTGPVEWPDAVVKIGVKQLPFASSR